jgi:hypothetical protein
MRSKAGKLLGQAAMIGVLRSRAILPLQLLAQELVPFKRAGIPSWTNRAVIPESEATQADIADGAREVMGIFRSYRGR